MLTYVINTSENKTFDSDLLFELVGYDKIRWMHSSLAKIEECAEEIFAKQNVIGAEDFRIVVLLDFYGYDLVRKPYQKEAGLVEAGIYRPFLEVYLHEHLFDYFEKRNLPAEQKAIYYIQYGKYEQYRDLANAEEQAATIFGRPEEALALRAKREAKGAEFHDPTAIPLDEIKMEGGVARVKEAPATADLECLKNKYSEFYLECTASTKLRFAADEYSAYQELTFVDFFRIISQRRNDYKDLATYSYEQKGIGGDDARAAYDSLNLSLYLVRLYEREEEPDFGEKVTVPTIKDTALKNVLERALRRVHSARTVALTNNCEYFKLELPADGKAFVRETDEEVRGKVMGAAVKEADEISRTPAAEYTAICQYATHKQGFHTDDNKDEFNALFTTYLVSRDETRARDVESEFEEARVAGRLETTAQCPAELDYKNALKKKHAELEAVLSKALEAEYVEVDFKDELTKAEDAYKRYLRHKSRMTLSLIGDGIFLILTLLIMLIPYMALQLQHDPFSAEALALYGVAAGIFAGVFIFSFAVHFLPIWRLMKAAQKDLHNAFRECVIKHKVSFYRLKKRYEFELQLVEKIRYEIRAITALHQANARKEECVRLHRDMLERVEDCLRAILNKLRVRPVLSSDEDVADSIALTKPFRAPENKIYKVFSIEAIDEMFTQRGGNV